MCRPAAWPHPLACHLLATCLAAACVEQAICRSRPPATLQGLRLLLARGKPPVLGGGGPVHIGGAHSRSGELCVMLRLLRDTAFRASAAPCCAVLRRAAAHTSRGPACMLWHAVASMLCCCVPVGTLPPPRGHA